MFQTLQTSWAAVQKIHNILCSNLIAAWRERKRDVFLHLIRFMEKHW